MPHAHAAPDQTPSIIAAQAANKIASIIKDNAEGIYADLAISEGRNGSAVGGEVVIVSTMRIVKRGAAYQLQGDAKWVMCNRTKIKIPKTTYDSDQMTLPLEEGK